MAVDEVKEGQQLLIKRNFVGNQSRVTDRAEVFMVGKGVIPGSQGKVGDVATLIINDDHVEVMPVTALKIVAEPVVPRKLVVIRAKKA